MSEKEFEQRRDSREIAVVSLLEDKIALKVLPVWRQFVKGEITKDDLTNLSDQVNILVGHLGEVYRGFEPDALHLIGRKIALFGLTPQEREDIVAEQKFFLWKAVANFYWEQYPSGQSGRAVGAFFNYLYKSTGSFFANDLIEQRGQVEIKEGRTGFWVNRQSVERRPPEDCLLLREEEKTVEVAFASWKGKTTPHQRDTFQKRYLEGMTISEIAVSEGVSERAIKGRLNRGKRKLREVLNELGELPKSDFLTKAVSSEIGGLKGLYDQRREYFLEHYERWRVLLPPGARRVFERFYGLNGQEPVFDCRQIARELDTSWSNVRVSLSYCGRIIAGTQELSREVVIRYRERRLYESWMFGKGVIGLTPEEEEVLDLHFKKGLSFGRIGEMKGVGEETARRRKVRAIDKIRLAQSEKL